MTKPEIRRGPRFMKPDREIEKTDQPMPRGTLGRGADKCGTGKRFNELKAEQEKRKAAREKREKAQQDRQKATKEKREKAAKQKREKAAKQKREKAAEEKREKAKEERKKRAPNKVTKPRMKTPKTPYKEPTLPNGATRGRVLRSDKDPKSLLPGLP